MNTDSPEISVMNNNNIKQSMELYHNAVKFVSERLETWTSSDVRLVAEAKGYPELDKPSQWGNVIRSAQAAEICEPLDKFAKSRYRGTNSAPRLVWQKLNSRRASK